MPFDPLVGQIRYETNQHGLVRPAESEPMPLVVAESVLVSRS